MCEASEGVFLIRANVRQQMKNSLRMRSESGLMQAMALACGLAMLTGCATAERQATASETASAPFVLVPGKPGEALPPMNKAVAANWPPAIRQGIDALVVLKQKTPVEGRPATSNAEIERILGVQIVGDAKEKAWKTTFTVKNWLPEYQTERSARSAILIRNSIDSPYGRSSYISLPIAKEKFCLNPYEVAVYLGSKYKPLVSLPPHGSPKPLKMYPEVFEWGMFSRGGILTHISSVGPMIEIDNNCIVNLSTTIY